MTTVNVRREIFWMPPDFHPNTQRTTSHKYRRSAASTVNSRNYTVPLQRKAGSKPKQSGKTKFADITPQGHDFHIPSETDSVKARGTC